MLKMAVFITPNSKQFFRFFDGLVEDRASRNQGETAFSYDEIAAFTKAKIKVSVFF